MVGNAIELQALFNAKLMVALDKTMERLLIELQNLIQSEVYGWESSSFNPWSINRTGQFLDSWQTVKPVMLGSLIQGEINQAIEKMEQFMIGNEMVHEDRDNLAEILNTGDGYNFGMSNGIPKPYFDKWIQYVNENLETIFMEECIQVKLPIQRAFRM